MRKTAFALAMGSLLLVPSISVFAYDLNGKISFEGTFTGVYQYLDKTQGNFKDHDRGSGAVDLGLSFTPTDVDEFHITGSFASGNGLKDVSPFNLAPNADDLEDDVKNINGHKDQDAVLELWYAHDFNFDKDTSLKLTLGIIDATVYIDDNRFANDEISQFMNDVFVNTPLTTPPSYDLGAVAEFNKGPISIKLLGMQTKDTDVNTFYQYYALQLGYHWENSLGEGNYRIYGFMTNKRFPNWTDTEKERLKGIGISVDQDIIKDKLGAFLRAGWQDDKAQIDYEYLISFGVNIPFSFLGRGGNELGIGYAYLDGADRADISNTHAIEAYAKFPLFTQDRLSSDITLDFQYLNDNYKSDQEDKEGFVYGVRWNLAF